MKDLIYHQFYNFIKDDYLEFKSSFNNNQYKDRLKSMMFDLVTKCPNQNASELSKSFQELGLIKKQDFVQLIDEIRKLLKITAIENYVWKDIYFQDDWFYKFKSSCTNGKSYVYLYRQMPHLETFFVTLRNAIAHGHFYIKENHIIMWNLNNRKLIKGLIYMKLNQLNKIVKLLNDLYEKSV